MNEWETWIWNDCKSEREKDGSPLLTTDKYLGESTCAKMVVEQKIFIVILIGNSGTVSVKILDTSVSNQTWIEGTHYSVHITIYHRYTVG